MCGVSKVDQHPSQGNDSGRGKKLVSDFFVVLHYHLPKKIIPFDNLTHIFSKGVETTTCLVIFLQRNIGWITQPMKIRGR